MYAINPNDEILPNFGISQKLTFIKTYRDLITAEDRDPVMFRGMTQRKTVALCNEQNRDFFYVDTGYLGSSHSLRKEYHRVVKNNVQHTNVNWEMPTDRFKWLSANKRYLKFPGWKRNGTSILVVTPSDKPCKFYGIKKDEWLKSTLDTLKKCTDRPIIIREKENRKIRSNNHLYKQMTNDNIFALVTYNSIAAIEAIGFGIPAFVSAPNAAQDLCSKDITNIENPYYADTQKVEKWQHWLAYCQYSITEMQVGKAFKIIQDYNLT